MKHLRQRNITDSFESLQKRTKVCLEDPVLEKLFSFVVDKGLFGDGEYLLAESLKSGLFREFVCNSSYEVEWKRILFNDGKQHTFSDVRYCKFKMISRRF